MKNKIYIFAIASSLLLCLFALPLGLLGLYAIMIFYISDSPGANSTISFTYPHFALKNQNYKNNFVAYDYNDYQMINFLNSRREAKVLKIENTGISEKYESSFSEIAKRLDFDSPLRDR